MIKFVIVLTISTVACAANVTTYGDDLCDIVCLGCLQNLTTGHLPKIAIELNTVFHLIKFRGFVASVLLVISVVILVDVCLSLFQLNKTLKALEKCVEQDKKMLKALECIKQDMFQATQGVEKVTNLEMVCEKLVNCKLF